LQKEAIISLTKKITTLRNYLNTDINCIGDLKMAMRPKKKMSAGGMVKKMRGGGMVKKMRGGGMVKKMRKGGMVKKK
jgi:hypothetical protein